MELSHVISDAVLGAIGLFVFFRYLMKLDLVHTLLWESFVLSVAVAAILGAMKFSGIQNAGGLSVFFQKMAATVGAMGLVAACWYLMNDQIPNKITGYLVIGIGFLLFALDEGFGIKTITAYIPLICMGLVALIGIYGLVKGRTKPALLIFAGVLFAALASFRDKFISDPYDSVDAYHYLLAISLLCFGIGSSYENTVKE